jgi:hypothetical protein
LTGNRHSIRTAPTGPLEVISGLLASRLPSIAPALADVDIVSPRGRNCVRSTKPNEQAASNLGGSRDRTSRLIANSTQRGQPNNCRLDEAERAAEIELALDFIARALVS